MNSTAVADDLLDVADFNLPVLEWTDKAAGFVGYGYTMGARAVESLRLVMAALQVATVRPQVGLGESDAHKATQRR